MALVGYHFLLNSPLLYLRVDQIQKRYKPIVEKLSEIDMKECAREGTICIYTIVYYS